MVRARPQPRGAGALLSPAAWFALGGRQLGDPSWPSPSSLQNGIILVSSPQSLPGCPRGEVRRQSTHERQQNSHVWSSGSTRALRLKTEGACVQSEDGISTLRSDQIFSQALSCFINAGLIWGKRKTGRSAVVVLYAVNWQCFGTKNNFCTRVLTASLSRFASAAAVLPGRAGRR